MTTVEEPWPAFADYVVALQDPLNAFRDPALRAATVETDSVLGLPKAKRGQVASVYKVGDARKSWAVRCFNFASPERAERYRAISNFLARSDNRYTVDFAYLQNGIVVGSRIYPILKMEWVEGDPLDAYIAKHLDAPLALQRLAGAWVEMVRDLHALGMAHADLQPSNVLVTQSGELKLIDYDGMFVPAFAGLLSPEDGHPSFQHPCRQPQNFGPQLDNFSAWSVYLSIVAVARDRSVWETLGFGEESLALRHADYVRPSASAAFAALGTAADADVRKIAAFVRSLLAHEPESLPALEHCSHIVASPAGGPRSSEVSWRFAAFENEPLEAGVYSEPFEPRPLQARSVSRRVPSAQVAAPRTAALDGSAQRLLMGALAGAVASVAGFYAFNAFGFATGQIVAVIVLGWALAAALVVASRSPKPPQLPPG